MAEVKYNLTKEKETKNKVVYGDGEGMHIYTPKEDATKIGNPTDVVVIIKQA